jgi:arylsulfatase A-like enzyme
MKAVGPAETRHRAAVVLLIALWFGLAAGLAEGLSYLVLQANGWVSWETRLIAVDPNILWASPVVDVSLFVLIACLLLPSLWLLKRFNAAVLATGLFATAAYYAVLAVSGRIHGFGVLMLALGLGVVTARWMNRNTERGLRFLRRTLIPLISITILAGLGGVAGKAIWEKVQLARLPSPPTNAPNVLLIVLDDLRADRVGADGYNRPTTPFLDEFARRGVLFEKAFANSSWSLTSHASLFTGRLPYQHEATLWPYDDRYPTLVQVLASRGYATAGFAANTYFLSPAWGLTRGFQHWENIFTGPADSARRTLFGRKFEALILPHLGYHRQLGRMNASQVNRRLLRWLDRRPDRPFFVFLNYMEMHAPYSPPPSYLANFTPNPDDIVPRDRLSFHWHAEPEDSLENPRLRSIAYDASLAYLDAQLRQLFEGLERRGLEKNLLVIITSDHGELLGEHNLIGHGTGLYLQQFHVPLLIVFPSKVPAGLRISDPVGLQAIPSTVAELAGLGRGPSPDPGLAACWSDGTCGSGMVISELVGGHFPGIESTAPNYQGWIKSVVTARWHFLLQQDGKVQLFDWAQDPEESQNLADTPQGEPVAERLGDKLAKMIPGVAAVWQAHAGKTSGLQR